MQADGFHRATASRIRFCDARRIEIRKGPGVLARPGAGVQSEGEKEPWKKINRAPPQSTPAPSRSRFFRTFKFRLNDGQFRARLVSDAIHPVREAVPIASVA